MKYLDSQLGPLARVLNACQNQQSFVTTHIEKIVKITDKPVVVEQTFQISKERLWSAITELNQMTQWFFENIETFKPKVGFKSKFVTENEGRKFPHLWTITEVEPYKKITYNWKYEGYAGDSDVTFELIEQENGTRLKLTHRVLESFPQDIPEFTRESCVGGWNYFIKQSLMNYLNNQLESTSRQL